MSLSDANPEAIARLAAVARQAATDLLHLSSRYSALSGETSCSLISTWESTAGTHARAQITQLNAGLAESMSTLTHLTRAADEHAAQAEQAAHLARMLRLS